MALDCQQHDRLARLLARLSDESMSPADWAELDALLAEEPAAVDLYVEHQIQEALLHREFGGARPVPIPPLATGDEQGAWSPGWPAWLSRPTFLSWSLVALATGLLFVALVMLVPLFDRAPRPEDLAENRPAPGIVAEITGVREAVWAKGQHGGLKTDLAAGTELELESGLVGVTFQSGARTVIEGPAVFRVDSSNAGTLRRGKLAAHVDQEARGFVVNTEYATVTDLGTEFGVEVRGEAVQVAVYEGEVEVSVAVPAGTPSAVRVNAGGVATADRSGALNASPNGAEAVKFVRDIRAGTPSIRSIALTGPEGGLVGEVPFQSHNQKVVANWSGIFVTHAEGILQRSTDGGRTFQTVFNARVKGLKPPTLETDEDGNVYLIYPENSRTRFLKFDASNGYIAPVISKAYGEASSGSMFTSIYDPHRRVLHHATQSGYLLTIDLQGKLLRAQQVFQEGPESAPSFPYLFVDETGVVHYAMTTCDRGGAIPYETIRYLKSTDCGGTWQAMDGKPVSTPTTCGLDGLSTMINLPAEVNYKTWLTCMHAKGGKVHFAYLALNPEAPDKAGNPPKIKERQHYMRFDSRTGKREIDSWSDWNNAWKGDKLRIHSVCGMFVSDPADPKGPLFAVGALDSPDWKGDPRKLAALVSYDNGMTWQDYAVSGDVGKVWAEGGFRCVTQQGQVIGTFAAAKPKWATTLFFQFDATPGRQTK